MYLLYGLEKDLFTFVFVVQEIRNEESWPGRSSLKHSWTFSLSDYLILLTHAHTHTHTTFRKKLLSFSGKIHRA
jgi:hypothetical protein